MTSMETVQISWRDVVGYEGRYRISNDGQLMSIIYKPRILVPIYNRYGYVCYNLMKDGKLKFCTAHRMVALAFLPNKDGKPHINHINGVKDDNRLENLEWVTAKENAKHAYATGLAKSLCKRGADSVWSKPIHQYSLSGELLNTWPCVALLAREAGWKRYLIYMAAQGRMKTAYGFRWEYANL